MFKKKNRDLSILGIIRYLIKDENVDNLCPVLLFYINISTFNKLLVDTPVYIKIVALNA